MTRETIEETVLRYLARAIDAPVESLDSSQSMKVLGANSLDIVEVVSSSMRELRIRVPRAELNNLANVDDLIELLHQTHVKKSA